MAMPDCLLTLEWIYNKTPPSPFPSSHRHLPNAALQISSLLLSLCALSQSVVCKIPLFISLFSWAKPGSCVCAWSSLRVILCTFLLRICDISDI